MIGKKRSALCIIDKESKNQCKKRKRRLRELAEEAASRTLNGNGSSPNLPPLPISSSKNDEGLGTMFAHPYGALPFGNIYMSSTNDQVRQNGLGVLRCLNDEQVLSVLGFLDGRSLSKVLQCSRFLYVAGYHDELWRDLTLRSGFKNFQDSWRNTFVWNETTRQQTDVLKFVSHKPFKVLGVYSDTFFRSWLCRSFTLQSSWLSVNNVIEEHSTELSLGKFLSNYEEKNIPVVVRGATKSWPALKKWNREYLIEKTQGMKFRATSGVAPLPANFTMQSYAKYCDSACEEAPLYLFDRTFADKCPQILKDYSDSLKKTCPFFDDEAVHGHDLFSLLGEGKRPDHRWIIVGPKRSGSSFHIDPNGTHAWNAPIVGRKRWIFYPPGVSPPGVFPSPSGDDVIMPISLGEWFLTHWNDHVEQRSNPDPRKRPLECTVEPGDILFVPHGWWHCVLNLDDGMSVALTQNYVSKSNLPDVLRFLRTRQQQISGCRDRAEAIPPEHLLSEFEAKLKKSRENLLIEAQKNSEKGWQCEAWTDFVEGEESHVNVKQKGSSILRTDAQDESEAGFSFSFF